MPKVPSKTAKPVPKKSKIVSTTIPRVKPAPRPFAERLAEAADRECMYASDLIRFPEILRKHGLDPKFAFPGIAATADQLNRERTRDLLARYNSPPKLPDFTEVPTTKEVSKTPRKTPRTAPNARSR